MKFSLNNTQEKPVIMVKEDADGNVSVTTVGGEKTGIKKYCFWIVGVVAGIAILSAAAWGGYQYYDTYVNIGIPQSFTSRHNIHELDSKSASQNVDSQVIMTKDTIDGVPLEVYELSNLKADIELDRPDSTRNDVYFYCRSSNFTNNDSKKCQYYGGLVIDGKQYAEENSRPLLGYAGMKDGKLVIGVAKDNDVKDYCIDNGGSCFRQYILVSAGVLPTRFYVAGLGRRQSLVRIDNADDGTSKYYYIRTNARIAIHSFAKVLYDYGVTDAIYLPGADEYCYYRTPDGQLHDVGDPKHKTEKNGVIPWIVFKKK